MARKSVIARNQRRMKIVAKYAAKRAELKARSRDLKLSDEERWEALISLQQLPGNSAKVRLCNRCQITGRAKGVYRKFNLGRNVLREVSMRGEVPGLVKASW